MTDLTRKRVDIIKNSMINYGIEYDDKIIMSLWDLYDAINSCWYSKYFVNTNKFITKHNQFALEDFQLYELHRAVLNAVKNTNEIELKISPKNEVEYLEILNN